VLHLGNEKKATKVFIQPVINNTDFKYWSEMTDLGEANISRYYFFGPSDIEITDCENSYLLCNGKEYVFLKAEPFKVEGQVSHWEGVLKIREELFNG